MRAREASAEAFEAYAWKRDALSFESQLLVVASVGSQYRCKRDIAVVFVGLVLVTSCCKWDIFKSIER